MLYKKIILLCLLTVFFMAASCEQRTKMAADINMPIELENVWIGMKLKEFKRARPAAKWDEYGSFCVEEDLDSDFFSDVIYWFQDKKLVKIILDKGGKSDYVKKRVPGLVIGSINKWGDNYFLKAVDIQGEEGMYRRPYFTWNKDGIGIQMSYYEMKETTRKADEPNFSHIYTYYIIIYDAAVISPSFTGGEPALKSELEHLYLLEDISNYNGPVFE